MLVSAVMLAHAAAMSGSQDGIGPGLPVGRTGGDWARPGATGQNLPVGGNGLDRDNGRRSPRPRRFAGPLLMTMGDIIQEPNLIFRIVVASLFSAYTVVRLACTWRLRHLKDPAAVRQPLHNRWRTKTRYEPGYLLALRDIVFGAFVATGVAYPFYPPFVAAFDVALPDWLRYVAVAFAAGGLVLLASTHRALGEYWSAGLELKDSHRLISNGPYRYVRHPMYTAVFLFFGAVAVTTANWLIIGPAMAIILVLSVRIRFEEAMMLDRFGETYSAYAANTGALVPRPRFWRRLRQGK
ncbi:MAG TPA: isoprenylcysteine carboxylmethyltransferase family protein [Myxococcota bacterium]|nr:isoprenylcysteine carboxylmethyltransferase family protein [Myxococcota bacterium]